jgi:ABC-type phosphate/phosphonate transport system substrate-binding protein
MLKEKTSSFEIGGVMNIPPDQEKSYKSVLAVGTNIPVSELSDVIQNASDFVLFLVSPESTSGNLVPRLHLASLQPGYPERFFLELQYAGDHAQAMEHALKGEYALCAFGSNEYDKLGADTVRLRKLWVSPVIPPGPVVFRKALSGSLREELQKTLLGLHADNPAAFEAIKTGWTEFSSADKYRVVEDSYYEGLLKLSVNREVAMKIIRDFMK